MSYRRSFAADLLERSKTYQITRFCIDTKPYSRLGYTHQARCVPSVRQTPAASLSCHRHNTLPLSQYQSGNRDHTVRLSHIIRSSFVLIQNLGYSAGIMTKKNIGSSFDDFLREESLLEAVNSESYKRVESWTKAKSPIMAAVHETASGFHRLGFLDDHEMQKFDEACTDIRSREVP